MVHETLNRHLICCKDINIDCCSFNHTSDVICTYFRNDQLMMLMVNVLDMNINTPDVFMFLLSMCNQGWN